MHLCQTATSWPQKKIGSGKIRKDLNAKGHTKNSNWGTQFDRNVRNRAPRPRYRTCFHPRRENHSPRRFPRNTRRSRYTLRPLSEAAAMRIVAAGCVGKHCKHCHRLHLVQSGTARKSARHLDMRMARMIVSGHYRHLVTGTHVPGMHSEHRRHRHLGPSRNDHQQKCRNPLLRHTNSSITECRQPPSDPDHAQV